MKLPRSTVPGKAKFSRCASCDSPLAHRKSSSTSPFEHVLGRLKVLLIGIDVSRCPRCQIDVAAQIPAMGKLLRAIAETIVELHRPLLGAEIAYLRRYAGFSAVRFSMLLGITPEHLSRVENGHTQTLGKAADRLVRAIASCTYSGAGDATRDLLIRIADALGDADDQPYEDLVYRLTKQEWKKAA
ncbi:MAG: hypothetical protein LC687_05565 [Actinobacteria bacterium]|nr:hypothetical protein [Actinomycetota bacterium]